MLDQTLLLSNKTLTELDLTNAHIGLLGIKIIAKHLLPLAITSEVSAIWGTALCETKLPTSTVSNPHLSRRLMYCALSFVAITFVKPCMASRGVSVIIMVCDSFI